MSRFAPICAAVTCVILSACVAVPENHGSPGVAPGQPATPQRPASTFDWVAERSRIVRGLSGFPGVTHRVRDDGALQLLLPGADAFPQDGEEPGAELRKRLDRIAEVLAPVPETEVHVFGHTDSLASELHNLQLSIRRAENVADHLRSRGIALARLRADGKGESEPVADNATEAGRALNRRVEIVVKAPPPIVADAPPRR